MKLQKVKNTKALMNIVESQGDPSEEKVNKMKLSEEEIPAEVEAEVEAEATPAEVPAEEPAVEEPAAEEPKAAIEPETSKMSFGEALNTLTQNYWSNISYIKSIVLMLKEQETSFPKDDIISILTTLSDDATIGVGMLAKASEIVDDSAKKLMDIGAEKAEEITSGEEPEPEVAEEN